MPGTQLRVAPDRVAGGRPGALPAAAALLWTLLALVGFALLPFYTSESSTTISDGTVVSTSSEQTIFEHEGAGVLPILLVPVGLALLGLAGAMFRFRPAALVAAGLAVGLCVLGMMSIGLFYLPTAALLVVAAVRGSPRSSAF